MSHPTPPRPAFTLRFQNAKTHHTLRMTAEMLGISMNELAERAITHELAILSVDLEKKLGAIVELLRSYRGDGLEEDVEAFARAEISEEDPLRSRGVDPGDAYGIGALFAHPVER